MVVVRRWERESIGGELGGLDEEERFERYTRGDCWEMGNTVDAK